MTYTPRQTASVITFVVLIILYCSPTLVLGWYMFDLGGRPIDFDATIPKMIITFSTGIPASGASNFDLLSMFHRVLLPISTFIAGIISVAVSRSHLTYALMGLILILIALVFVTYLAVTPNLPTNDASRLPQVTAIGALLSQTFDTLFSYILLFLGLSVAKESSGEDTSKKVDPEKESEDSDSVKEVGLLSDGRS